MPRQLSSQMRRLPKRKQPKEKRLSFLCTEQEVEAIKTLALKAGYNSTSELLRAGLQLVEQELENQAFDLTGIETFVIAKEEACN